MNKGNFFDPEIIIDGDRAASINLWEIYAYANAYLAHLETVQFKKYKRAAKEMIEALGPFETVFIIVETKGK